MSVVRREIRVGTTKTLQWHFPFVLSSPARSLQPPAAVELDAGFGLPARAPGVGEAPRPDTRGRPGKLRRQEERVSCHRALTPLRGHQVRWVPPSILPVGTLAGRRCGTLSSPSPLALEFKHLCGDVCKFRYLPLFQNVRTFRHWPHSPLQGDFSDRHQLWQMGP